MGYGRGPPTRAHKRRVMEFDCTKTVPRQLEGAAMNVPAGAGADTAPVHRVLFHLVSPGLELVVSLKTTAQTTSHHRVPAATAARPSCSVSGCCLRDTGTWKMTSGNMFPHSARRLTRQQPPPVLVNTNTSKYRKMATEMST